MLVWLSDMCETYAEHVLVADFETVISGQNGPVAFLNALSTLRENKKTAGANSRKAGPASLMCSH